MTTSPATLPERDVPWFALRRWSEYEGEQRANQLRLIGIAAFYAVELLNRYGLRLGALELPRVDRVTTRYHWEVTALAVAWVMLGLGVMVSLRRRVYPGWLKYVSTAGDLGLLTAVLAISDGPRSPLVAALFLIVVLSGLRFDLSLVRFATAGAMAAYLIVNGYARWFTERDIRVPRYYQLIVLIALALTGIILGQIVRRVHGIARQYAQRVQQSAERTT